MSELLKGWEILALEAMSIAFDEKGQPKNNIELTQKKRAKDILYRCIDELGADLAWPYIKLADLLENENKKTDLFIKALNIEPNNIYAIKYLFHKILADNPSILNKYIT